ncbi:MAG TPA: ThuA domain-containing protein [Acidimicrobiales bacterium]|nr:ThuA domain-containing protein [Acidimicrobiales bacterium]
MTSPVRVHLVCGGRFHDFDYARLQLLGLLAEDERIRTTVAGDYRDLDALAAADSLVTYTCDVRPSPAEQAALRDWVAAGGRWFALHGTNAALEFTPDGVAAPRVMPVLAQTLGSQFVAHPPIAPYRVEITEAGHPLVRGIEPFETSDELYLSEFHGEVRTLLHTRFTGEARGFVESAWPDDAIRPVMYLRRVGSGEVLYLTLGHCRGHYDMQPVMDYWPTVDRGSWESDQYRTLLRRGIGWMCPAPQCE